MKYDETYNLRFVNDKLGRTTTETFPTFLEAYKQAQEYKEWYEMYDGYIEYFDFEAEYGEICRTWDSLPFEIIIFNAMDE